MPIQKVGVAGCGLMGSGIAQVCAQAGFQTVVREVNEELLKKGIGSIEKNLARMVEKGTIGQPESDAVRARL
ncbi:MAG: 3-hydroxyacyl-CoA dehydrogenase NAD-binding domain-containing protein, partial [Candidatus Acidiferrales bacterium]